MWKESERAMETNPELIELSERMKDSGNDRAWDNKVMVKSDSPYSVSSEEKTRTTVSTDITFQEQNAKSLWTHSDSESLKSPQYGLSSISSWTPDIAGAAAELHLSSIRSIKNQSHYISRRGLQLLVETEGTITVFEKLLRWKWACKLCGLHILFEAPSAATRIGGFCCWAKYYFFSLWCFFLLGQVFFLNLGLLGNTYCDFHKSVESVLDYGMYGVYIYMLYGILTAGLHYLHFYSGPFSKRAFCLGLDDKAYSSISQVTCVGIIVSAVLLSGIMSMNMTSLCHGVILFHFLGVFFSLLPVLTGLSIFFVLTELLNRQFVRINNEFETNFMKNSVTVSHDPNQQDLDQGQLLRLIKSRKKLHELIFERSLMTKSMDTLSKEWGKIIGFFSILLLAFLFNTFSTRFDSFNYFGYSLVMACMLLVGCIFLVWTAHLSSEPGNFKDLVFDARTSLPPPDHNTVSIHMTTGIQLDSLRQDLAYAEGACNRNPILFNIYVIPATWSIVRAILTALIPLISYWISLRPTT